MSDGESSAASSLITPKKGSRAPRPGAREHSKEEKGKGPHQPSATVVSPMQAATTRAARIHRGRVSALGRRLCNRSVWFTWMAWVAGPGAPEPMLGGVWGNEEAATPDAPEPAFRWILDLHGRIPARRDPCRPWWIPVGSPPGVSQFLDAPTASRRMALRDSHLGPFGTVD